MSLQVLASQLTVVFRAFHGLEEGRRPAGNESDDQVRGYTIGGRALGCVQHAETSGSAGTGIEQPAALMNAVIDQVHTSGDFGKHFLHRFGTAVVFFIDQAYHVDGGERIDMHGSGIALLRIQFFEFHESIPPVFVRQY